MSIGVLGHHLADLGPDGFEFIPVLNIYIAKSKARNPSGNVITGVNWYETKQMIQRMGPKYFLPTSFQWEVSRKYLLENKPESEKDFSSGESEWTDSFIVIPNEGNCAMLIERAEVERSGDEYSLIGGDVKCIPELPLISGYIKTWDNDLGLPLEIGTIPHGSSHTEYFRINTEYSYDNGSRAVVKSSSHSIIYDKRLYTLVDWSPLDPNQHLSFRLCKVADSVSHAVRTRLSNNIIKEVDEILSRLSF